MLSVPDYLLFSFYFLLFSYYLSLLTFFFLPFTYYQLPSTSYQVSHIINRCCRDSCTKKTTLKTTVANEWRRLFDAVGHFYQYSAQSGSCLAMRPGAIIQR